MKLDDIKAKIDSFFDNISEEEFFDLITAKYNMPVVYEIDIPLPKTIPDDIIPGDLDEIDYSQTYSGEIVNSQIVKIESSYPSCEMGSNYSTGMSDTLSYAA
ncbi:MAG: hypothetical protein HDT07_01685 [Bacteroidales bacterium]|nr:hypothetical protein [Bacteroidales bacterium]